jgi:hypothetical protein
MQRVLRGSSALTLFVLLLMCQPWLRAQDKDREPTREELRKEVAALRELLSYQGTWKRPSDGSQIRIEGHRLTWYTRDGKAVSTSRLKIVEVHKHRAKVESVVVTGDDKGSVAKSIAHRRGPNTLFWLGATAEGVTVGEDGYPEKFSGDHKWTKVP